MKLKSLLFMGAFSLAGSVNAQSWVEDSVVMDPGYASDVFYSMHNGIAKTESNKNWQLAFQMTPPGPYGNVSILANHVQGKVQVYSTHMKATGNYGSFTAADTSGMINPLNALYNTDSSWNFGAFNRMADAGNQFDYSWGKYDLSTHDVKGDSLYVITVNGAAYKVWIQLFNSTPLDSVYWKFRIAQLDNTGDTTVRIYRKDGFTDRLFAYFNVLNNSVADREPSRSAWDILFTRYVEYLPGAPGSPYYNVTGVLSNFDVEVAQVNNLPGDSAHLQDQIDQQNFSKKLNEIGSDWKVFNMTTFTYDIDDSLSYFVKSMHTNEYYQLQFTGFTPSFSPADSARIYFKKRFLGSTITGVHNVTAPLNAYFLAPNPAANQVSMMIDAKENASDAKIMITDITGRVVSNKAVNVKAGLNAFNMDVAHLSSGTYMVLLTNGKWKIADKLVVQH